jgi:DNA-binding beta-propeller fold protein YncE
MRTASATLILGFIFCCFLAVSCKHTSKEQGFLAESNYPPDIAKIIVGKCATAGCHNAQSGANADGIILDTWEHMFYGGNNGAVVVPFSTDFSPLLYFINTDSALGAVATPTMPYQTAPLSKDEFITIKTWIANGAPDKDGRIAFADNAATRQKIYVTQQMASQSMVAVIDAEKQVVMRYIPLGVNNQTGLPHSIKVTPAGDFAYACMYTGRTIKKIDCTTDQVVGEINIDYHTPNQAPNQGAANWNVVYLYNNGQKMLVSKTDADGALVAANGPGMQQTSAFYTSNFMSYPHGIASNEAADTFFITSQNGNVIYRWPYNSLPKKISLDTNPVTLQHEVGTPDPHEVIMSPDYSKYFVSCQNTNEVRVFDAHNDTLMKVIPVGRFPQEFAISKKYPYLFVTCSTDPATCTNCSGSVCVINYESLDFVKKIEGVFNEPHGIAVDDNSNTFYIMSRNQDPVNGIPSHHCVNGNCKSGWYEVFSTVSLQSVLGKRCEILPDPYAADTRFK